ncbi:MAG: dihydroorotate dehydrogenase electron transfer subunit [Anaerovoracaceae bacterium]|jgi:dihydroorotate dehydrogenase electron transfer subunit
MKDSIFSIRSNGKIARDTFEMKLDGDTSEVSAPGQFVDIKLEGFYLRRPISICDCADGELTLIYKVVGGGTRLMAELKTGEQLSLLCPLGNGYDISVMPQEVSLAAGGAGVPPMYGLAKELLRNGKTPTVYLGFKDEEEAFYVTEFEALGLEVKCRIGGYISDIMPQGGYVCSCGPEAMLRAVSRKADDGQFSFEARMGCGFGACMGCSCKTKYGAKRICKDGPVLQKEEIIW